MDGAARELRAGESWEHGGWRFHVAKTYRAGIPGEFSQMGVARAGDLALPPLIDSARQMARRRMSREFSEPPSLPF
jgi:hypothetical protein